MPDLDTGPQQSSVLERRAMDIAAASAGECVTTLPSQGVISGVGRLAASLDELSQSGRIGAWHIGPWVNWRHMAIRIKFDSVEDGRLSEHVVRLDLAERSFGRRACGSAGSRASPARGVKQYFHAADVALPCPSRRQHPLGQL
jgi:hypothetical protein